MSFDLGKTKSQGHDYSLTYTAAMTLWDELQVLLKDGYVVMNELHKTADVTQLKKEVSSQGQHVKQKIKNLCSRLHETVNSFEDRAEGMVDSVVSQKMDTLEVHSNEIMQCLEYLSKMCMMTEDLLKVREKSKPSTQEFASRIKSKLSTGLQECKELRLIDYEMVTSLDAEIDTADLFKTSLVKIISKSSQHNMKSNWCTIDFEEPQSSKPKESGSGKESPQYASEELIKREIENSDTDRILTAGHVLTTILEGSEEDSSFSNNDVTTPSSTLLEHGNILGVSKQLETSSDVLKATSLVIKEEIEDSTCKSKPSQVKYNEEKTHLKDMDQMKSHAPVNDSSFHNNKENICDKATLGQSHCPANLMSFSNQPKEALLSHPPQSREGSNQTPCPKLDGSNPRNRDASITSCGLQDKSLQSSSTFTTVAGADSSKEIGKAEHAVKSEYPTPTPSQKICAGDTGFERKPSLIKQDIPVTHRTAGGDTIPEVTERFQTIGLDDKSVAKKIVPTVPVLKAAATQEMLLHERKDVKEEEVIKELEQKDEQKEESATKKTLKSVVVVPQKTMINPVQNIGPQILQNSMPRPLMMEFDIRSIVSRSRNGFPEVNAIYVQTISGGSSTHFDFPIGCHLRKDGRLIVADTGNNLVKIMRGNDLEMTIGKNDGVKFIRPSAVVTDSECNIYVKDDLCVQIFNVDGNHVRTVGLKVFKNPYGLALVEVPQHGTALMVLDAQPGNARLHRYLIWEDKLQTCHYQPLYEFGLLESKVRFFAVHREKMLTSDLGASTMYLSHINGQTMTTFGRWGEQRGEFKEPSGVDVDAAGNWLVGDSKNNRVQVFKNDGEFLATINFSAPIRRPSGIHLTAHGTLYVINYLDQKIKVYHLCQKGN